MPAGDRALLVRLGDEASPARTMHVRRLTALLRSDPPAGVDNLHPAYASVLIRFDPMRLRIERLTDHIVSLLERVESLALPEPRRIEIPVRYGGQHGPDLDDGLDKPNAPFASRRSRHTRITPSRTALPFVNSDMNGGPILFLNTGVCKSGNHSFANHLERPGTPESPGKRLSARWHGSCHGRAGRRFLVLLLQTIGERDA